MKRSNNHISTISLMDLPGQYRRIAKDVAPEIARVLASGRYILGPEVTAFEHDFATYCHARYCIGTSSGTESLYLSLLALDIKPGDEVITVPNTFTATAEVIYLAHARIVFCDVDPKTMNMDHRALRRSITKRTRAVIPVHFHGNPVDMDEIFAITLPRDIAVIEDAAQAHGATYKGDVIGSLRSDFTCFSFHPVKNLGAFGDAGAITTNNKQYADRIRLLINHGRTKHHTHAVVGTTGRMDALQAAVLRLKLTHLDRWLAQKTRLVAYYKEKLPPNCVCIETTMNSQSAHHVLAVLVKRRDALVQFLARQGIETGIHYPVALHLQPAYANLGYKKGDFSVSEHYVKRTVSLPLYPHMSIKDVDRVCQTIRTFYE